MESGSWFTHSSWKLLFLVSEVSLKLVDTSKFLPRKEGEVSMKRNFLVVTWFSEMTSSQRRKDS